MERKAIKTIIYILISVIVVFICALLLNGRTRKNYCSGICPKWMWEWSYAHKGLHAAVGTDENSIGAFANAVEAGYAIELDLRYTKDMVPMVSHDNDLTEEVGENVRLSDISYDQAKMLSYVNSGEHLASLEEVLTYVDGRVPLLIEIKSYHLPGKFEENIVSLLSRYKGPFAIQSYSPFALNYVRKLNPSITVGLLYDDVPGIPTFKAARILKDNLFGALCHPAFITYNASLVEAHELDIYRSDEHILLGFLFTEDDILTGGYKDKVDGIVFERLHDQQHNH